MAKFYWTVKFAVDETWVQDGFELTEETAKDMIENALPYAYSHETSAKIIAAPHAERIRKAQGFHTNVR